MKEKKEVKVGLALACRFLGDYLGCPPDCDQDPVKCRSNKPWMCWQKYIAKKATEEAVCRECGCTQQNACPEGCHWVEDDLCSSCVTKKSEKKPHNHAVLLAF